MLSVFSDNKKLQKQDVGIAAVCLKVFEQGVGMGTRLLVWQYVIEAGIMAWHTKWHSTVRHACVTASHKKIRANKVMKIGVGLCQKSL